MAKATSDVKELQRKLSVIAKLAGHPLHLADGLFVFGKVTVTDAPGLYAACTDRAPSLSAVLATLRVEEAPVLVTAKLLATAHRNLVVVAQTPSLRKLVDEVPKLFRRVGPRIDARWIAAQEERLAVMSRALRGTPPESSWARVVELVRLVHGDAAAVKLDAAHEAVGAENDDVLGTYGLAFRCIERDGAPTPLDETIVDSARVTMTLALRHLGSLSIPLGEVLALVGLAKTKCEGEKAATVDDHWLANLGRLAALEIPIEDLSAVMAHEQLRELVELVDDPEAARLFADWVRRLAPQFREAQIPFPLSAAVVKNLRRLARRDLALVAVCLLMRGKKADPRSTLQNLDVTLGLLRRYPEDAAALLARVRETPAGVGRAALPAVAAWLEDDALLDRFVHLCVLAGEAPVLSQRLRLDFERGARLLAERAHLAGLAAPTPAQRRRLDALEADDAAAEASPLRTRRRIGERIEELTTKVYERELDRVSRVLLERVWGIALEVITPAWRDALRFHLAVDDNRDLLRAVLRLAAANPGKDVAPQLAPSAAWLLRARQKIDVEAWLSPPPQTITLGTKRCTLAVEHDALETLRMGIPFDTCLSIAGAADDATPVLGSNAASTVLNVADANKRVLYLRDANGGILARKLVALTADLRFIGYNLYIAAGDAKDAITAGVQAFCEQWARACRTSLASSGEPEKIHEGFWYDDGTVPFGRLDSAVEGPIAELCAFFGLPCPPETTQALVDNARALRAWRKGDANAAAAVAWRLPVDAGAWFLERLGRAACIAAAADRRGVSEHLLRHAAAQGPLPLLQLAGELVEWSAAETVRDALSAFPYTAAIAFAIVDAGNAMAKAERRFDDHGFHHITMYVLPRYIEEMTVAQVFDLCDRAEPLWELVAQRSGGHCAGCSEYAAKQVIENAVVAYRKAPDPAAVLACLKSARRSRLAHAAAVRIAASFDLGATVVLGSRALDRMAARDPSVRHDPTWLAARLRHSAPADLASLAPLDTDEELFERLGPLLAERDFGALLRPLCRPGFATHLGPYYRWTTYFLRRNKTALGDALARAALAPGATAKDFETLAILGDVVTLTKALAARSGRNPRPGFRGAVPGPRALSVQLRIAHDVRAQVALPAGAVPRRAGGGVTRTAGQVDMQSLLAAERVAIDETRPERDREVAIALLFEADHLPTFARLMAHFSESTMSRIAAGLVGRILREKSTMNDPSLAERPLLLAQLAQHAANVPDLASALGVALGKQQESRFLLAALRGEETARAAGLTSANIVDRWVRALLDGKHFAEVAGAPLVALHDVEGMLARILQIVVVHKDALRVYSRLEIRACKCFLRELVAAWSPDVARACADRSELDAPRRFWLELATKDLTSSS